MHSWFNIFSVVSSNAADDNKMDEARKYGRASMWTSLIGLLVSIVIAVITIICVVVKAARAVSKTADAVSDVSNAASDTVNLFDKWTD